MMVTYYRSVSPVGGRGVACVTVQQARRDAVDRAAQRKLRGTRQALDERQYWVLWRGLEGQGWRVEQVSPTGSPARSHCCTPPEG